MIKGIEVHAVRIPMGRPFAHAGKRRTETASVLVAVDADGTRGWGEGAPRSYVTGETVDGAVASLRAVEPDVLASLVDPADFPAAVRAIAAGDIARLLGAAPAPAAAAALEIALFDLVCRLHQQDGFSALRCVPDVAALLRPAPTPVPVSFVLDLSRDPGPTLSGLADETVRAVRHVKLKATADVEDCVRRVGLVRARFGPDTGISVDANGAWAGSDAVRAADRLRPFGIAWIEEPVAARDWATMRAVRETGGVPVMLDESCTGLPDLDAAAELGAADYVNARISKCGGIFPTLRLIAAARERGLGSQLGVHVGEVGPLWAAARLLGCAVDSLATVEAGRQDEWFPEPLTEPPYAVDRRTYVAAPLAGAGTGVVPSDALVTAALLQQDNRADGRGGQR